MKRAVVILSACALGLAAEAGMPPMPVIVAPAERGVVRKVLPTVGTVRALREVKVGSKIAERVAKLLVDEGDYVEAEGEERPVICVLDDTNIRLRIQEAKARLAEATAVLAKAEAGLRPKEIEQEAAALKALEAELKKLEADVTRSKKLLETKVIADSDYDSAVALRDIAKARLEGGRAKLALAREGTRQEEIAQARADEKLREAELAVAQQQLKDCVIRSPVDGCVVRKHVEVGEWTQVGGTVAEIIDTSVLRVHTRVTEKAIRNIRKGMAVRIRLDAHPGQLFGGTVHRTIPKADVATRSFPVQVNVETPKDLVAKLVKPGMFARAEFVLDERENALLVPEDALVYRGGLAMVFVASRTPPPGMATGGPPGGPPKGKGGPPGGAPPPAHPMMFAKRAIVETGVRQEGKMEIKKVVSGTLDAGDLVVVVGTENMREGAMMIVVGGLPPKAKSKPGPPAGAPPRPALEAGSSSKE